MLNIEKVSQKSSTSKLLLNDGYTKNNQPNMMWPLEFFYFLFFSEFHKPAGLTTEDEFALKAEVMIVDFNFSLL